MAGIGIWQLVIVLVIVLLLFGTKRFKNLGGDLAGAMKGFKGAIKEGNDDSIKSEQTSISSDNSSK